MSNQETVDALNLRAREAMASKQMHDLIRPLALAIGGAIPDDCGPEILISVLGELIAGMLQFYPEKDRESFLVSMTDRVRRK